jgi:hypothetical protein
MERTTPIWWNVIGLLLTLRGFAHLCVSGGSVAAFRICHAMVG